MSPSVVLIRDSMSTTSSIESPQSRFRRSFTEKFGSYLSNKSAHISSFSIELDDPHRQYGPGETVKGQVVLNVGRPLGVTHIVVSLYGFVEVFKNHSKSTRSPHQPRVHGGRSAAGGSKRWTAEYYGDGFASLFEEEIVLCGEGRLDPKLYHFRFEIDFPADLDLPSSIDFERGQVTYMLSAMITRPNAITVPTTRETVILYRDSINVGLLPAPKPQKITLRAVDKSRPGALKRLTSHDKPPDSRSSNVSGTNESIRSFVSRDQARSSRHPSLGPPSSRSSSSSRRPSPSVLSDHRSSQYTKISRADTDFGVRNITAIITLGTNGCLAGEMVPVNVTVNHTKAVKSLQGVIVTLYRQARVDMHPNLPVISMDKVQAREDYYPRSRTGLGGLSLSAAGSSQVWRKDLFQTFAPLYVDPITMSTDVKVLIRVPDEAMPTIRNVPGDMISFKYHVEVIIDIHGKLAGIDSSRPMNHSGPQSTPNAHTAETGDPMLTAWGTNCADTTALRRDKNAIKYTFDLVIGTRDSLKSRGKRRASGTQVRSLMSAPSISSTADLQRDQTPQNVRAERTHTTPPNEPYTYSEEEGYYAADGYWYPYPEGYDPNEEHSDGYWYGWEQGYAYAQGYTGGYWSPPPGHPQPYDRPPDSDGYPPPTGQYQNYPVVPPPIMQEEAGLSEKERLRRAEAVLLPSAPPVMNGRYVPDAADVPSAPIIPEEAHLAQAAIPSSSRGPLRDAYEGSSMTTPRPGDGFHVISEHQQPSQSNLASPHQHISRANTPSQQAICNGTTPVSTTIPPSDGPSAPTLSEEDEALLDGARRLNVGNNGESNNVHAHNAPGESLPRYTQ